MALLNLVNRDELDLESDAEREIEAERQVKLRDALMAACRAVVRNVGGYDNAGAALNIVWGPQGRHVDGDKLRATLAPSSTTNRQNFRFEWIIWFATQSEEVRDLLDEMTGKSKPKKPVADELRDLKALVREELPKRAAAIIRKAETP